jgi:site-specific recombinase XerD
MPSTSPAAATTVSVGRAGELIAAYHAELARLPLADNTRRAYRTRVANFLAWLVSADLDGGNPLADPHARDYAVRDYARHLRVVAKKEPATVNAVLAALDHFYRWRGLGPPNARRQDLPQPAPRALEPSEQRRLLRAVERSPSARDRALTLTLFYAGPRISEAAALEVGDVRLTARKGELHIRDGKGGTARKVPLHAEARTALAAWLGDRARLLEQLAERGRPVAPAEQAAEQAALWLSRRGRRLTTRAIDLVVRTLGAEAGLEEALSAHVLRHTCFTNLRRAGVDLVTIAGLAGHARLDTTRRYTLPSEADRQAAIDAVRVEY